MKLSILKRSVFVLIFAACSSSLAQSFQITVEEFVGELDKMPLKIRKAESQDFMEKTFSPATSALIARTSIETKSYPNEIFPLLKEHIHAYDRALEEPFHFEQNSDQHDLSKMMDDAGKRFVETLKLRLMVVENMKRNFTTPEIIRAQTRTRVTFSSIDETVLNSLDPNNKPSLGIAISRDGSRQIPFETFNRLVLEYIENPTKDLKPMMEEMVSEYHKEKNRLKELGHGTKLPEDKIIYDHILNRLTGKTVIRSCSAALL